MIARLRRRLVIVARADPVICGHSGEARNLAEAALLRGFTEVKIITWPISRLIESGLPLKPLDGVAPYSPGIEVERPEPVGDYKVPDGRYLAGLTGRLVELFTDGVPTICMSLYLSPHTLAVIDAVRAAEGTGLPMKVQTIAEAVGSDVTNVVRSCVAENRFGAAAQVLSAYLSNDCPVAVSEYTRQLIISSAEETDARHGTRYAAQCRERVAISYPAINTAEFLDPDPGRVAEVLARRGLTEGRYVLFLSRLAHAKGVDDLIEGFTACPEAADRTLVIAGNGPQAEFLRGVAPLVDRRGPDRVPRRRRRRRTAGADGRQRGVRAAEQAPAGVHRDVRDRLGGEDALRRRARHHDRDRRHRRGGRATPPDRSDRRPAGHRRGAERRRSPCRRPSRPRWPSAPGRTRCSSTGWWCSTYGPARPDGGQRCAPEPTSELSVL